MNTLRINVPDFRAYLPNHSISHYPQYGNYPLQNGCLEVRVSASVILDSRSEYTVAYGYNATCEHEVAETFQPDLRKEVSPFGL